MSKIITCAHTAYLLLCTLILGACSVSDGYQGTGIEGTGDKDGDLVAARGSVTRFGSIYVNGIHFNTDNAEFFVNGQESPEDAIKQGMVVYVEGTPGQLDGEASATKVKFDYLLQGTIESIENISSNTRVITLLGYKVYLAEDAMMNEGVFDRINVNDFIAVSGFFGSDNTVTATRVDLPNQTTVSAITGVIDNHNSDLETFTIADQLINYRDSSFNRGSQSNIDNGVQVRVLGTLSPETNTFMATTLHFILEAGHEKHSLSEEGLVSNFSSQADFYVNGIRIDGSSAIKTGDLKQIIANGTRVTIKGTLGNDSVFIAETLHIHYKSTSRISGAVTDINSDSGTITVSGIEFQLGYHTNYEDFGPRRNRYFGIDDLHIGDHIDVFSEIDEDEYIGVTLKRKEPENVKAQIKGSISSFISETQFSIIGIRIDAYDIAPYVLAQLNLEDSVFVVGEYTANKTLKADSIYILKNKCTSHKEEYCEKQIPTFWPADGQNNWNIDNPEKDDEKQSDFNSELKEDKRISSKAVDSSYTCTQGMA